MGHLRHWCRAVRWRRSTGPHRVAGFERAARNREVRQHASCCPCHHMHHRGARPVSSTQMILRRGPRARPHRDLLDGHGSASSAALGESRSPPRSWSREAERAATLLKPLVRGHFRGYPQRDSNPCCRLERAKGTYVRLFATSRIGARKSTLTRHPTIAGVKGVAGVPPSLIVRRCSPRSSLRCTGSGRAVDRGCAPAGIGWSWRNPGSARSPGDQESMRAAGIGSGGGGELLLDVPRAVLVVKRVVSQAAVQDADQPVGEGAEGLVVGGAASSLPVVERPGAG